MSGGASIKSRVKRFPMLLFVGFIAALVAEPHGNYSETALGLWSPVILAVIASLFVGFIVWILIRKHDPAKFGLLSFPIASVVAAIGLFFFLVRKSIAESNGAPTDQAALYVLWSPTGLTLVLGLILIGVVFLKKRGRNDAQN